MSSISRRISTSGLGGLLGKILLACAVGLLVSAALVNRVHKDSHFTFKRRVYPAMNPNTYVDQRQRVGEASQSSGGTIVWVVLGDWKAQEHVVESMRQARRWNVNAHLVVLTSAKIISQHAADLAIDSDVELVDTTVLEDDETLLLFRSNFFISGVMGSAAFNELTSARLYILSAWMRRVNAKNIFHLENDNMIYFNVAEWVQKTGVCNVRVAMTCRQLQQEARFMVAGVVFVRSWADIDTILRDVNALLSKGENKVKDLIGSEWVNDMSLIAHHYWSNMINGHPPQVYTPPKTLTILPEGISGLGLDDPSGHIDEIRSCLWESTHVIFDNAALAIWFYGDYFDKKPAKNLHAWGAYERIPAKEHDLNWRIDRNSQLSYPAWNGARVASLHVHSKELRKVSSMRCNTLCQVFGTAESNFNTIKDI